MVPPRYYETTFIVSPEFSEDEYRAITQKFTNLLRDNGATILSQEIWGLKKLAYQIDKKTSGYYVFTEFTAPPTDIIERLEREFTYDERIIRSLTVKLDKFAVAYGAKRRARLGIQTTESNS